MGALLLFACFTLCTHAFRVIDGDHTKHAKDKSWLIVLHGKANEAILESTRDIFEDSFHGLLDSWHHESLKLKVLKVVPNIDYLLNKIEEYLEDIPVLGKLINKEEELLKNGTFLWTKLIGLLPSEHKEFIEEHVDFIERNLEFRASTIQTNPSWNLDRIDQISNELDKRFGYRYNGTGVSIYVMDSGVRTSHQEFEGRAFFLYNAFDNGHDTGDCNGHGTHVAGIVASRTYGVAKKATIYNVKVLDCDGVGSSSTLLAGMSAVATKFKAPAIISLSLGGPTSQVIDNAANSIIRTYGIMLVVAAGNDEIDACGVSPARVDGVITVGSTDENDQRSSYSNFGACLDVFAPGDYVRSLSSQSDTGTVVYSGTSMAAPHVAGVVAIWLSYNRSLTPSDFYRIIARNQTKGIVSDLQGSPNNFLYQPFNEGYEPNVLANSIVDFLTDNWVLIFIIGVSLIIIVGVWQMCKWKARRSDEAGSFHEGMLPDYRGGVSLDYGPSSYSGRRSFNSGWQNAYTAYHPQHATTKQSYQRFDR